MNPRSLLLVSLFLGLILSVADGADWPQFRGPERNGAAPETGLLPEWPKGGPKLLWTHTECGIGYSGPAVVGDKLYMTGGRGDSEYLFALDLKSGADGKITKLWETKIGPLFTWKGNSWNAGPNVTPTVDGDAVYALGGFGDLICVEAATGKERWRINLPRDLGGAVNPIGGGHEKPTPLGWGYAHSPLVDGDRLICVPGGSKGLLAALDKKTGKLIWQSKQVTDEASYSSPIAATVGGIRQYIQVVNRGIVGITAEDGKLLWWYKREPAYDDVVISPPVFRDNLVYASVGFGQGFDLIRLVPKDGAIAIEKIASNKNVQNRDGGMVLIGDYLYGHSEKGGWVCQEFKTGKVAWNDAESLGRGTISAADRPLYNSGEKGGTVVLVEPSPMEWKEKGRLKLPRESKQRRPSGGLWTHPAIANGKLYVRDQELLFCFDVKK
jgi:outer membrane protein assembly factor BamB